MLVLSRRESQQIKLGDSIVVTVVKVGGDRVRLGIEAPSDVLVLRGELERRDGAAPSPLRDGLKGVSSAAARRRAAPCWCLTAGCPETAFLAKKKASSGHDRAGGSSYIGAVGRALDQARGRTAPVKPL